MLFVVVALKFVFVFLLHHIIMFFFYIYIYILEPSVQLLVVSKCPKYIKSAYIYGHVATLYRIFALFYNSLEMFQLYFGVALDDF